MIIYLGSHFLSLPIHPSSLILHPSPRGNRMDINRFTEKAQAAVRAAQTLATRYNNQQIEVEHLALALLEQENGLVPNILNKAGVNVDFLKQTIESEINKFPKVTGPSGPV